jgi:hypothetical protein
MDVVIFILGIIYLCSGKCGIALAICAIIEAVLLAIKNILERMGQ